MKIQEKKFSIEEYCLGLRSLENSKIPFEEIQTNIKEISHLLESLANEIVNSDYLNKMKDRTRTFKRVNVNGVEYFSLKEVEVITHDLDLDEVRNHRINMKSMAH